MWFPRCVPSEVVIWKQNATKIFKCWILCLPYGDGNKKSLHVSAAHIDLPPAFRSQAKIVSLNKFSMEEIDDILRQHRH